MATAATPFDFTNKIALQKLREAINAALKGVNEEFGVNVVAGNASFTESSVTFKLLATAAGVSTADLLKVTHAKTLESVKAYMRGIDFNAVYLFNRQDMRIVGYDHKARKAPFIVEAPDGKRYKVDEEALMKQTAAKAAAAAKA